MNKIIEIELLADLIKKMKVEGKKVGLYHGCFDLRNPGIIAHLKKSSNSVIF